MIHTTHKETTALWIDDNQITASEAISLIRKQGNIPRLVQEWVLDNTVGHIDIDKNLLAELLGNYRTKNQLHTDAAYTEHLQKRHIDESLLLRMLARPYQVIKYRDSLPSTFSTLYEITNLERTLISIDPATADDEFANLIIEGKFNTGTGREEVRFIHQKLKEKRKVTP